MNELSVTFGKPKHGWLPITLRIGGQQINFDASDVPINPIDELLRVLLGVLQDNEGTVWWHLEPEGYYLHFEPKDKMVLLTLTSEENKNSQSKIAEITATQRNVVLTFRAAINTLLSYDIREHDWPETSEKNLAELEKAIESL
jgi:hypothetical protein